MKIFNKPIYSFSIFLNICIRLDYVHILKPQENAQMVIIADLLMELYNFERLFLLERVKAIRSRYNKV